MTAGGLRRRFADCCAVYIRIYVYCTHLQCTQYEICRSCLIIHSITRPAKIYRPQTLFPSPLLHTFPPSLSLFPSVPYSISFPFVFITFPFLPFILSPCLYPFPFPFRSSPLSLIFLPLRFCQLPSSVHFSFSSLHIYFIPFPLPFSLSLFPCVPYFPFPSSL